MGLRERRRNVTVYFIGAGPGAPDLITVRGRDVVARCPVCLFAGSLVPKDVVAWAPKTAEVYDTAPMTLSEILAHLERAHRAGHDVARLHSGDPSLYGAIAEQMRRLDQKAIPYEIIPGVPAFAAAAAALRAEFTLPEVTQTVILTRTAGKSSAMPPGEDLVTLAQPKATLALHLSIRNLRQIEQDLIPIYGADCPVAVVYRVSWPDQQIFRGTLATIGEHVRKAKLTRTALILVGRVLGHVDFPDSALYHAAHRHILRPNKRIARASDVGVP